MKPKAAENPTKVAIRRLGEARDILAALVLSSESFDYRKAKKALSDLDQKIRELGREEARLQRTLAGREGNKIVPFPQLELVDRR